MSRLLNLITICCKAFKSLNTSSWMSPQVIKPNFLDWHYLFTNTTWTRSRLVLWLIIEDLKLLIALHLACTELCSFQRSFSKNFAVFGDRSNWNRILGLYLPQICLLKFVKSKSCYRYPTIDSEYDHQKNLKNESWNILCLARTLVSHPSGLTGRLVLLHWNSAILIFSCT